MSFSVVAVFFSWFFLSSQELGACMLTGHSFISAHGQVVARAAKRKKKKRKKRRNKRHQDRKRDQKKATPSGLLLQQPTDDNKPELEEIPSIEDAPQGTDWQSESGSVPATVPAQPVDGMRHLKQSPPSDSSDGKNKAESPFRKEKKGGETEKNSLSSVSSKDFLLDVGGGILVQRGGRVDPGADLVFAWNLGKILGWSGLYLAACMDIFIGDSPLGAKYVLLDAGAGFLGRFPLGPVSLRTSLAFDLRNMFITSQGSSGDISPSPGLGFRLGADLDFALTQWLLIVIGGSAKLVQDPLTGKFEFSAVARGGVGFAF